MSGTINLSLSQQFDSYGKPLVGGQLYFFQAGTVSTPQNAFQDSNLTIPWPNPMTLDAAGRVPQFYLADGQIKIRLQDAKGVVQLVADNLLVIGPSAGGGGGGATIDPTTQLQTGDLKARYDNAQISGFVRCNGNTIGSRTSGASELADDTAQALFLFLWSIDPALRPPSGSFGTAALDWSHNLKVLLPDWRGRAISGLDGMGNVSGLAGKLTAAYFGAANPDLLGADGGQESRSLTAAQCAMPSHQHSIYARDTGHGHAVANFAFRQAGSAGINFLTISAPDGYTQPLIDANPIVKIGNASIAIGSVSGGASDNLTTSTAVATASAAHPAIGPRRLCTIYMKL